MINKQILVPGILCFLFFSLPMATAQKFPEHREKDPRISEQAMLFHTSMGVHVPAGDLADRFGTNGAIGGGLEYLSKGNFILGAEGHYLFGGQVKDDPLSILRTPEGDIIGNNQLIADLALRERGFYLGGLIGKLFTMGEQRTGIRLTLGAGVFHHKIRLQDNTNSVVQVTGDYAKGYDRLTGGIALNQFLGWQQLPGKGKLNWYAGLELNQGFTKSLRSWDFSEMRKLDGNRTDLRFGIRVGWVLPFYISGAEKIYY
ncbi:MAG: hypothetical protein EP344_18275 [Bacteroidetes bacterium]|nr:MAG: hypothetical protein EP344_18275 [Bacteroidota bacterium]